MVGLAFFLGDYVSSFWHTGIKAGPGFHARYFQLKGYDTSNREEFVEKRKGAYTA